MQLPISSIQEYCSAIRIMLTTFTISGSEGIIQGITNNISQFIQKQLLSFIYDSPHHKIAPSHKKYPYNLDSYIFHFITLFIIIMQNKKQETITPLLPLIKNVIEPLNNKIQLHHFKSDKQLYLVVITKGTVMCISDLKHSILSVKSAINNDKVTPLNQWQTNFYLPVDHSWIAVNSKSTDLKEPSQFPHAYQPSFYFQQKYQEYQKERDNLVFNAQCQVIQVYKWSIKVVNVSKSGYYGIVMQLLDFRYTGTKLPQNVASVSAIMYEHSIQQKLQKFRLSDLRQHYSKSSNVKTPYSLFYYCRHINLNPNPKKKMTNLVVHDKEQKMLTYDQERKSHFINFGNIDGANFLQYPINSKEIDIGRMKRLNLDHLQPLFNNIYAQTNKIEVEKEHQGQLWSSDEEGSNENQKQYSSVKQDSEKSQQSSDESFDDPLKNLYMREFKDKKIL